MICYIQNTLTSCSIAQRHTTPIVATMTSECEWQGVNGGNGEAEFLHKLCCKFLFFLQGGSEIQNMYTYIIILSTSVDGALKFEI